MTLRRVDDRESRTGADPKPLGRALLLVIVPVATYLATGLAVDTVARRVFFEVAATIIPTLVLTLAVQSRSRRDV